MTTEKKGKVNLTRLIERSLFSYFFREGLARYRKNNQKIELFFSPYAANEFHTHHENVFSLSVYIRVSLFGVNAGIPKPCSNPRLALFFYFASASFFRGEAFRALFCGFYSTEYHGIFISLSFDPHQIV